MVQIWDQKSGEYKGLDKGLLEHKQLRVEPQRGGSEPLKMRPVDGSYSPDLSN